MGDKLKVVVCIDSDMVCDPDYVPTYDDARTYYLPAMQPDETAAEGLGAEWAFLDDEDVGAQVRRWFLFDREWHSDGPQDDSLAREAIREYFFEDLDEVGGDSAG